MKSCARLSRRRDHPLVGWRQRGTVGDVESDGLVEKERVLANCAEALMVALEPQSRQWSSVDRDRSGLRVIEPQDEVDEGRLTRARFADDGGHLACRDHEVDRLQRGFRAAPVSERHSVDADLSREAAERLIAIVDRRLDIRA